MGSGLVSGKGFGSGNRASTAKRSSAWRRARLDGRFLHVQVFNFDPERRLSRSASMREEAVLRDGYWDMHKCSVVAPGFDAQDVGEVLIATNLTVSRSTAGFRRTRNRIVLGI